MFAKLWNDEGGSVALEYLVISVLIGLAIIVGANAVGLALNSEYSELANAIRAIDTGYKYSGFSYCACVASVNGQQVTDAYGSAGGVTAPITPHNISVAVCSAELSP